MPCCRSRVRIPSPAPISFSNVLKFYLSYHIIEEKAKEEILRLKERWGKIYPKVVKKWEDKAYALLTFLRYPKEIRQFIYTTNQIERLAKEIKRRIKVIEVFPDEGSVERLLYLLLKELNERLNSRKLRGFKEIESGNYHALPGEFFTQ